MDVSFLLNVFLLCLSVPTVLLRTFPQLDNDVCEEGSGCIPLEECSVGSIQSGSHVQCREGRVCCSKMIDQIHRSKRSEETKNEKEENKISKVWVLSDDLTNRRSAKSIYFEPDSFNRISRIPGPSMEYSIGHNSKEKNEEIRIVNIKLLNNTNDIIPTRSPAKIIRFDKNSPETIVFPDTSLEETDDKIRHIKKLYQKYTMDFKRLNSKKNSSDVLPKRKLKFSIGYKSAKHCKLYEKYTADKTLYAIPLLPSLFPILMQNNHCSKPLPLIVGGVNATKGEFPHMAGLGYDRGEWIDFLCGGSLISERYVLTAAHCANTRWGPPIIVRLGTRNLITDQGQNMDVEDVIVHPEYKEPSGYNDIALVKIAEGLRMERTLRPACLPPPTSSADKPGSSLVATGWGRTGFGLYSSPNLQKVSLKVMDNETCDQMFLGGRKTLRLPEGIHNSMLCAAGYLDSSHDTCQVMRPAASGTTKSIFVGLLCPVIWQQLTESQYFGKPHSDPAMGDSGGPLQTLTRHSKCMYELVGITSFGKLCGTGLPAIYTRVSYYVDWIEDIVWPF